MIGRGARYPLGRHVAEAEIWPRPVAVSATCRAVGTCLARPTIRLTHDPGWRGIRGAHAAYPGLRSLTPSAYPSMRLLLAVFTRRNRYGEAVVLQSPGSRSASVGSHGQQRLPQRGSTGYLHREAHPLCNPFGQRREAFCESRNQPPRASVRFSQEPWASARRLMCEASTHKSPKTSEFIGSKCFTALPLTPTLSPTMSPN